MRHTALLATAFLLVASSTHAQQTSTPMKDYGTYMEWCTDETLDQADTDGFDSASPKVQEAAEVRCQCEFEALPAPGVQVDEPTFNGAMQACDSEYKANPSRFYQKYKAQLAKMAHALD